MHYVLCRALTKARIARLSANVCVLKIYYTYSLARMQSVPESRANSTLQSYTHDSLPVSSDDERSWYVNGWTDVCVCVCVLLSRFRLYIDYTAFAEIYACFTRHAMRSISDTLHTRVCYIRSSFHFLFVYLYIYIYIYTSLFVSLKKKSLALGTISRVALGHRREIVTAAALNDCRTRR